MYVHIIQYCGKNDALLLLHMIYAVPVCTYMYVPYILYSCRLEAVFSGAE